MDRGVVTLIEAGVDALNQTYRTGDLQPWRRHVERACSADVVVEPGPGAFTEGTWSGHEGAVGFVANQMEAFEDMWLALDDVVAAEPNRAVVAVRFGGQARHSGIAVELAPGYVFDLRDLRITRFRIYPARALAVEAAGLE